MGWIALTLAGVAGVIAGGIAGVLGVPAGGGRTTQLIARAPERVPIPAGPFRMGSSAAELKAAYALCTDEYRAGGAAIVEASVRCTSRSDAETPQRTVALPAFAIDRTEVTVGAYRGCARSGACDVAPLLAARRLVSGDRYPLASVTWDEAAAYCRWRGGRLPTEAEWEKAARGVLGATWPWGDRWEAARANHGRRARLADEGSPAEDAADGGDGYEGLAPVASFPGGASPYGVLDMAGNLWEWTDSVYAREPPQASAAFAPSGPASGAERVLRGGSYETPPSDLRAARRVPLAPGDRHPTVGFRCAYD